MRRFHIFNPAAGGGHSPELLAKGAASGDEKYVTAGCKDAEKTAFEVCLEHPDTHFIVYGGDGTVNEVANGIIKADAGMTALLSVVPTGTGNDLVRSFPEKDRIYTIDAVKYNDRYAVNILNFGFDSRVVLKTVNYKRVFPGSAAYIAGVVDSLCHRMSEKWQVTFENEDGEAEVIDDEFTLALAANCKYYGGGFKSAPVADPSDGLIDFIAVPKVSRATFIKLVGDYKKGSHFDPVTKLPVEKFEKCVIYRKCKKITIDGITNICADGEIENGNHVEISIAPSVLRLAT